MEALSFTEKDKAKDNKIEQKVKWKVCFCLNKRQQNCYFSCLDTS